MRSLSTMKMEAENSPVKFVPVYNYDSMIQGNVMLVILCCWRNVYLVC